MADDAREILPQDEVIEMPDSGGLLPDPNLLQYYSDMADRCYWLDEEINSDSLWLVKAIVSINREDAGIPVHERQKIKIYIDSCGGDIDAMRCIIDAIELSDTPITTINMGRAYSAALEIFLAGHDRRCTPRARFMIHDGDIGIAPMPCASHMIIAEQYQHDVAESREYIIDHTDITEDMLNEHIGDLGQHIGKDWYFGAKEAYDLWVVDGIIESLSEVI